MQFLIFNQTKKCNHNFCSKCFKKWAYLDDIDHFDLNNNNSVIDVNNQLKCKCLLKNETSRGNSTSQEKQKLIESTASLSDINDIKRCPKCSIPIERAEGCAQIMCKFCRHTFCFYCLESLEVKLNSYYGFIFFSLFTLFVIYMIERFHVEALHKRRAL
jgi:hypothetical protein